MTGAPFSTLVRRCLSGDLGALFEASILVRDLQQAGDYESGIELARAIVSQLPADEQADALFELFEDLRDDERHLLPQIARRIFPVMDQKAAAHALYRITQSMIAAHYRQHGRNNS